MADGPWIESHSSLRSHPKVRRLMRHLSIGLAPAIGHLHLLWWSTIVHAPEGDISKWSPDDIAGAAEWPGDGDEFTRVLIESGWIEQSGEAIVVHDWSDYAGRYIDSIATGKKAQGGRARASTADRDDGGRFISAGQDQQTPAASVAGLLLDSSTTPAVQLTRPDLTQPNLTEELDALAQDEPERMSGAEDHETARGASGPQAGKPRFSASEFAQFWAMYPRKVGKRRAESAYRRALGRANAGVIHAGAERLRDDPNLPEQQYVPHPERWLNRDGWEDEALPTRNGAGNTDLDRWMEEARRG